jgi:hypothetical protein
VLPKRFAIDDAYITLHNARVLMSGVPDPMYGSSYLVGATSAIYLALLALLGLMFPLPTASFIVLFAAVLLYAIGLERLARDNGLTGWRPFGIVLIGLLWGYSIIHLLNGLETGLSMAVVTWLLVLANDRRWLPVLGGLAPFVRPELVLLAGPLMARLLWQERSLRPIFPAVAVALPFAAWYWLETGSPLPSTGTAKILFFGEINASFSAKLVRAGQVLIASALPPLFIGFFGHRRVPAGWCAAFFVLGWLALSTVTLPSSLHWNDSRYTATLVPALLFGFIGLSRSHTRITDFVIALLVAISLRTGLWVAKLYQDQIRQAAAPYRPARAVAKLPPGSVVLLHDAGLLAWANPQVKLVDVVGLKSPQSQRWHRAYTRRICGWDKALDAIARETHATHLVALDWGFWVCVKTNLQRAGWKVTPVFGEQDHLYRIERPAALPSYPSSGVASPVSR